MRRWARTGKGALQHSGQTPRSHGRGQAPRSHGRGQAPAHLLTRQWTLCQGWCQGGRVQSSGSWCSEHPAPSNTQVTWLCEGRGRPPEGAAPQGADLSRQRAVTTAPQPWGRTWRPSRPEAPPLAPAPASSPQDSHRGGEAALKTPAPRQPVEPKEAFPLIALRGLGHGLGQLGVKWEAYRGSCDGVAGTRGSSCLRAEPMTASWGPGSPDTGPGGGVLTLGRPWPGGWLAGFSLGLTLRPSKHSLRWPFALSSRPPDGRPVSGGGPSPCWAAHVAMPFGLQGPVLLGRPIPAFPRCRPALPAVLRDTAPLASVLTELLDPHLPGPVALASPTNP